jgi:hypothetical protein
MVMVRCDIVETDVDNLHSHRRMDTFHAHRKRFIPVHTKMTQTKAQKPDALINWHARFLRL